MFPEGLDAWINEDRSRLLAEQEVTEDAHAWQRAGRDNAFLYAGSRLQSVRLAVQDTESYPPWSKTSYPHRPEARTAEYAP